MSIRAGDADDRHRLAIAGCSAKSAVARPPTETVTVFVSGRNPASAAVTV